MKNILFILGIILFIFLIILANLGVFGETVQMITYALVGIFGIIYWFRSIKSVGDWAEIR